tara:strand:+ start:67 stop:315 length:249 start_codon:yes stop_codon:yes gene_type:complete
MKAKRLNFLAHGTVVCPLSLNMPTQTYPSTLDFAPLERLLDELDETFPDKFPDHNLSQIEIAFRAGQLDIIRLLKHRLNPED